MREDDVNVRQSAPKLSLTIGGRVPGQDDLSDPVPAVRVGANGIPRPDIEGELYESITFFVPVKDLTNDPASFRHERAGKDRPLPLVRKVLRKVLSHGKTNDLLIIIEPEPLPRHLGKTGRTGPPRDLDDVNSAVLQEAVTVHRTVVEPCGADSSPHLPLDHIPHAVDVPERDRMPDRRRDSPDESFRIIRQDKEELASGDHRFDPEELPLDEFLDQAVILPGLAHALSEIDAGLLRRIAAVYTAAPHEVDRLQNDGEGQVLHGGLKLLLRGYLTETGRGHAAADKGLLHEGLVRYDPGCLPRRSGQTETAAGLPDRTHPEVKTAGRDPVRMEPLRCLRDCLRIRDIDIGALIRQRKPRPVSGNTGCDRPVAESPGSLIEGSLRIGSAQNHQFFHIFLI